MNKLIEKLKDFFQDYNEWLAMVPLVAAFLFIPVILGITFRAGGFDAGLLHVPVTALLMIVFASGGAWLGFKFNFPQLHGWFVKDMQKELLLANPHDSVKQNKITKNAALCFGIYLFYFISLLAFMLVLLLIAPV
jgi:hypothetical protein